MNAPGAPAKVHVELRVPGDARVRQLAHEAKHRIDFGSARQIDVRAQRQLMARIVGLLRAPGRVAAARPERQTLGEKRIAGVQPQTRGGPIVGGQLDAAGVRLQIVGDHDRKRRRRWSAPGFAADRSGCQKALTSKASCVPSVLR